METVAKLLEGPFEGITKRILSSKVGRRQHLDLKDAAVIMQSTLQPASQLSHRQQLGILETGNNLPQPHTNSNANSMLPSTTYAKSLKQSRAFAHTNRAPCTPVPTHRILRSLAVPASSDPLNQRQNHRSHHFKAVPIPCFKLLIQYHSPPANLISFHIILSQNVWTLQRPRLVRGSLC